MKLLFDENLSRRLLPRIADLFPQAHHVGDVQLVRAPDSAIWAFARDNGFAIVTADADFFDMVTALGPPPKVIWLRNWAKSTKEAESLLRREAIRIVAFLEDPSLGLLVLPAPKSASI